MHLQSPLLLALGLVLLLLLALVVWNGIRGGSQSNAATPPKYRAKALLTPNEAEFLLRLEQAAPELRFHAQVAMAALVEPDVSRREDGKEYMRLRGKVAQKMIDFVAQDRKTGEVVALIELDDRTHQADRDADRDSVTKLAGYRTIRWQSRRRPDNAQIRAELIPPPAPAAVRTQSDPG
jgi:very-short-patch-repair endonuclease